MGKEIINFFKEKEKIKKLFYGKEVFIFLDYDGTLTPIVETPDLAVLHADMKEVLLKLVDRYTVSIISGRATDDVSSKVGVDNIYYAGSHGFEIAKPDGRLIINEKAQHLRGVKDRAREEVRKLTENIEGSLIEDVKYTVSCHYRLVADENIDKFKRIIKETVSKYPGLKVTEGKKVLDIRPDLDWNKGKAVEWILDKLKYDPGRNLAVYIGDDITDEDAFAVLEYKGFGILVAGKIRPTKAKYYVRTVDEVKNILLYFVELAL
ncbi:MAG: trehalose-phosphatase [Actinomycetota bacterium]|nr:trehalose-phosphatase [Actinomycetota bacterium]